MTKLKHKLDEFLKLNISNKNKSITHTRIGDKIREVEITQMEQKTASRDLAQVMN